MLAVLAFSPFVFLGERFQSLVGLSLFNPGRLLNEHRWVVSYPQRHYESGQSKDQASGRRYKRTIRMFKAARHQLVEKHVIGGRTAPSYSIECLLYNVPDRLYRQTLGQIYCDIVKWLSVNDICRFKCQNRVQRLFGQGGEQWNVDNAQRFIGSLARLWEEW